MEKCNSCGLCVKNCGTNNVHLDEKGAPRWGRDCLFCFYCEMKCPNDAITSIPDWPVMAPFMSYNVYQAKNDPLTDKAKILHPNRKTKQI